MGGDAGPFKQCTLARGTARVVSWIPSRHAVVGKMIEMPELLHEYYEVISVAKTEVTREWLETQHRNQRNVFKDHNV